MDESFEESVPRGNGSQDAEFEAARQYVEADLKKARQRRPARAAATPERLPPHSQECEQGVIGCCLLDPVLCLPQVISKTNSNPDVCYDLRHQTILAHLIQMWANGIAIDLITVQQRLKDFMLLDSVGGIPYLSSLADVVPSGANLPFYLETVLEKFLARTAIKTCSEYVGRLYDSEGDIPATVDEFERDVLRMRRDVVSGESSGMKELIHKAIDEIEQCFNRNGALTGIGTGFADFDKMTSGLQNGDLIIIAARPSLGKTSLLCQLAEHAALDLGLPVAIFSLEMTKRSLTTRILCSRARVNARNISEGFMSEADFPKLTSAAGKLSNSLIRIDDTPGLSIMALRARARTMQQQFGIKLFGVDYLQLVHSTSRRARESRQQEISDISGGLKALAKELDVPVVALSQLNRDVERHGKRRPRLSDLRESGAQEADADVVGLLYKANTDDENDDGVEQPDGVAVNLLIAKQRNGPTGDVHLTFLKPYTRFESAAKVSDVDVPYEPSLPYSDR